MPKPWMQLRCFLLVAKRLCESKNKKITRTIIPSDSGRERDFSNFENDFSVAIGRVIHHKKLEPIIFTFTEPDFYSVGSSRIPGHLIADVRIQSDKGSSIVNVAGFAIAAANELGELSAIPQKVFQ
jgi:hypothetical protein